MSKQATTFDLAKLLMCSQEQATAFRNEVNYLLVQRGHPAIPLEQICAVVRRLDAFTVTSKQAADYIARPAEPVAAFSIPIATDVPSSTTSGLDSDQATAEQPPHSTILGTLDDEEDEDLDTEECREDDWPESAAAGSAAPSLSPESARTEILTGVLALGATSVTYEQIEQIMAGLGLDPAQHDDEYAWVLEKLDEQEILVVEALGDAQPVLGVTSSIESNLAEINAILRRVFGKNGNDNLALLTAEEQRRLLEIVQEGRRAAAELDEYTAPEVADRLAQIVAAGERAYEQLLLRNRRLVASIVLQCCKRAKFLTMDDLMQEGMMGLAHAIDRFDLDSGWQLSTYATWWIRQAVARAVADQDRTIRLPVHQVDKIGHYWRAVAELSLKLDHEPTAIEIAGAMHLLSPKILEAIDIAEAKNRALPAELERQVDRAVHHVGYLQQLAAMHPVSLDTSVKDHEESTLGDFVPDSHFPAPEAAAFRSMLQDQIWSVLGMLSPRECDVIVHRFGLSDDGPETLETIGDRMGVTRERVRQIEAKALLKLRHPLRMRHLRDYVDFDIVPKAE